MKTGTEERLDAPVFQVLPNPVVGKVTLSRTGQVTLYDLMGCEVVRLTTASQGRIQVDHLSSRV